MSTATFDAAIHLVTLGRPEEALQKLAEDFDPEDAWQWWLRGVVLLDLDRFEDARAAAESGLALEPDAPMLLALLARCRLAVDDLPGAEAAVLAALRGDPEEPDNLALYARIVAGAGQLEKARKLVARARRINPENASALRMQSVLAIASGDDREAVLRSRELLAIDPEDVHAHRVAGAVLHGRGDAGEAAAHLRSAVMLDPSSGAVAELARENLVHRNPFMWPLRPVQKFGIGPVWIAAIAIMFATQRFLSDRASTIVVVAWVSYCVYSWVVPSLVRRYVNRL